MIDIETEYFSLNKILLLALGLWPYKQSNFTQFQFVFLSSILMTNIIFQCTTFISQKCTADIIIKVLSSVFFFGIFATKYYFFYVNINNMKDLLGQLLHTYNEIKDEHEIAIINEYGRNSKRFTVALTIFAVCSIFFMVVASCWSDICNVILPTNASKSHYMMTLTEYFIDQEKYFHFILFHLTASMCIGSVATLGIGTTFITFCQLTFGMFKIASYRIERAMSIDVLQNINHKSFLIFEDLVHAVKIHRQAMTLFQHFISTFETMMFGLVIFTVGSFSLNLFRISQIASSKESAEELICPFIYAAVAVLYMFIANYIGQVLTNLNHDIFVTAYNIQWYVAPLYIQRMILFLLQRNSKSFTMKVGGLFVASIECFATLVKTSVSYFTVIYSTR